MREPLEFNKRYILYSEQGEKFFYITSLVGAGATCLVYDAYYLDEYSLRHKVRLKECYPIDACDNVREKNGVILWNNEEIREKSLEAFEKAYEWHIRMQNNYDFVNVTSKIVDYLYAGNDTKYLIMECDNGKSFDKINDYSLYEKLKVLRALVNTIGKYHNEGWLHLDLKPENFMIIPETPELVKLFDFDSMVSIDALKEGKVKSLSYSGCWAAPEVKQSKISKIGPAADVYSIGAILYYMLFDVKPDLAAKLQLGKYNYDNLQILNNVNPNIKSKITLFLKKAMSPSPEKRFQSMDKLIIDLDEMMWLADPKRMFLTSNMPVQTNYFIGRTKELIEANNILRSERLLIVTGIGGVGKTEFSQYYAKKYENKYSCLIWAKVDSTLKELILDDSVFNINGFNSKEISIKEKLQALKSAVDENTLIILDNVNDYEDEILHELLNLSCKIMITSRMITYDFMPNINQICLDCMEDDELMDVFSHYYKKTIMDKEIEYITDIIHTVGNYTLLIPIIAKQMHLSAVTPIQMLEKMKTTILATDFNEKVKHRKDMKLYEGNMMEHVANIFKWTDFTDDELLALKVISMLGNIKVSRKSLAAWCGFSTFPKTRIWNYFTEMYKDVDLTVVNNLIEKGVLNYNAELEYVSIHDVIATVIDSTFDKNISSYNKFTDNITTLCKAIEEWKEEYDDDCLVFYDNISEYQIDMYLCMIMEVLNNIDCSIQENVSYVIQNLERVCVQVPIETLEVVKNIEKANVNTKKEQLVINRVKMECYFRMFNYYRRGDGREKFEEEKRENTYQGLIKAMKFAKVYFKEDKESYSQYCLYLCKPVERLVSDYSYTFYEVDKERKIYKKILTILNMVIKESNDKETIVSAERLRTRIIKGNREYLKYEKEKSKPYVRNDIEVDDLDNYKEILEKTDNRILVVENALRDIKLSLSGKRCFLEEVIFSWNYWPLAFLDERIDETMKYTDSEAFYFQRLFIKLYYNGFLKEEMPRNTWEGLCEDIITECALRKKYKALLHYMDLFEEYLARSYKDSCDIMMFISITLTTLSTIPKLFECLGLQMLANQFYRTLSKVFLSKEVIKEFQEAWDINNSGVSKFLFDAMNCAEKSKDLDSYRDYQRIRSELFNIDFLYGDIPKDLKSGIMRSWNYYIEKIVSDEPFEDINKMTKEIEYDTNLDNTTKEMLLFCVNEPYDWDDVIYNSTIITKGYKPSKLSLEELQNQYQTNCFNGLIEKMNVLAGICFMSYTLDEKNIYDLYIEKYKELLKEIMVSDIEILSLLKYESLPSLWETVGYYEGAYDIYLYMYNNLLCDRWKDYTYYECKLTKEIYENMFRSIISRGDSDKVSEYGNVREQYMNKYKELESKWDEEALTMYC